MEIEKVVIPLAGMGTGLLPATKSQPKEMLPVACKPVVQYVVEEMVDMISASRAYEAGATAMTAAVNMAEQALGIGR